MKQSLSLLLLCTLIFSSHTSNNKGLPLALWSVIGDCRVTPQLGESSVALAYFQSEPNLIYIRIEEGQLYSPAKSYQSSLNRAEALKALRNGSFINYYINQPIHASVMPKREFLKSMITRAFTYKNKHTSQKLRDFCNKVDGFYKRMQK